MNASLNSHAESATAASRRLGVNPEQGLAAETIAARQREFGANKSCRRAGIAVKMISGNHRSTATAIAHELGLQGETLSGTEIERIDAAQL